MHAPRHIAYVDGRRYRRALLAGARHLIVHHQYLNEINVFPVPDSDTGTNLATLCQQLILKLASWNHASLSATASMVAEVALLGARGNSGAILAQFLVGLAEALEGTDRAEPAPFAEALLHAQASTYHALAEPREGTILTVMRVWAEAFARESRHVPDFLPLLKKTLPVAEEALRATEEQLEVLREAHVVDAGALGFVYLLQGIFEDILHGPRYLDAALPTLEETPHPSVHLTDGSAFRFCTEGLLHGEHLPHETLQEILVELGDSVVVAGSSRLVRFHIHTDHPPEVFQRLRAFGKLSGEKVDDIYLQTHPLETDVAIVTDSGCDLPQILIDRFHLFTVPYRILFCEESFLDRYGLTIEQFFELLHTHPCHPTTSQPPPGDFRRIYEQALSQASSVISIHVTSKHSGTYQSALNVARTFGDRIHVIDSRSVSVGIGLLALTAAEATYQQLPVETIVERVCTARKHLRVYLTLPTLEYLVRGGRVSTLKGTIGRWLGLHPLLRIDESGTLEAEGPAFSREKALQQVVRKTLRYARTLRHPRFAVAHARAPETAAWLAEQVARAFGPDAVCFTAEISPALSVHGGPGAAGIAVTEDLFAGEDTPIHGKRACTEEEEHEKQKEHERSQLQ